MLGSGKFFLIAAVIAYALNNITAVRDNIREPMQGSLLFPLLVETGSYIMHLDTEALQQKADSAVEQGKEAAEGVSFEQAQKLMDNVTSELKEQAK